MIRRRPPQVLLCTVTASVLAVGGLAGCGSGQPGDLNQPGTNLDADGIEIRYAHLEDPEDTDEYPAGADVPLYLWLINDSDSAASLTAVSSPLASSAALSTGALPVPLPPGEPVRLGPLSGRFVVLQDIGRPIRGAELIPVTLSFGDGAEVTFDVEMIEVDADVLGAGSERDPEPWGRTPS